MKVTEITVTAGRVVNHPYENYSNLRPSVTLKASLEDGEDFTEATKELQAKAEQMIEDHKNNMLTSLRALREMEIRQREMASLEQQIKGAQTKLDELRSGVRQLEAGEDEEPEVDNEPF